MVVFTCNKCGESLKKNQVEKHGFRCIRPPYLTCVDCLKDFRDDYVKHTACISEKDRYSAKGLGGHGQQKNKQQLWIETVHDCCGRAIDDDLPGLTTSIRSLLTWLQDQGTIPDKWKTFSNYCINARRGEPMKNVEFVWSILDKARNDLQEKLKAEREAAEAEKRKKKAEQMKNKKPESSDSSSSDSEDDEESKPPKNETNKNGKSKQAEDFEVVQSKRDKKKKRMVSESESVINGTSEIRKVKKSKKNPLSEESEDSSNLNNALDACHLNGLEEEKLSKKERKEKKKREKYEAELKNLESGASEAVPEAEPQDEPMEEVVEENESKKGKKKKKKDKKTSEETAAGAEEEPSDTKDKRKEKKSKKQQRLEEAELIYAEKPDKKEKNAEPENGKLNDTLKMDEGNVTEFSWDTAILQVLESQSDHEISMKKLSKKILNEYLVSLGDDAHVDEAKIINKFHKKLQKMHNVLVHKDKVRLKTSRD